MGFSQRGQTLRSSCTKTTKMILSPHSTNYREVAEDGLRRSDAVEFVLDRQLVLRLV